MPLGWQTMSETRALMHDIIYQYTPGLTTRIQQHMLNMALKDGLAASVTVAFLTHVAHDDLVARIYEATPVAIHDGSGQSGVRFRPFWGRP